jgi:hypothetical protein
MVSRYDAILAGIPTSLVGGVAVEKLLGNVGGVIPFFALGLVVALLLVTRALFAGPVE